MKNILIDASQKEELRIALIENGILQDFERESALVRKIKGNIYLAQIVRIEPSLQAAFVEYGEERNGFLPFSEIHFDYYQISNEEKDKIKKSYLSLAKTSRNEDSNSSVIQSYGSSDNHVNSITIDNNYYSTEEEADPDTANFNQIHKKYNIQDVIKLNQVVLVQVAKEERGNKGASLTTHISLAGKYCVLLPNTSSKGGISKKVINVSDRRNLRNILNGFNIPEDKSVIIRTAGVGKKEEDLKKDYEYLVKLWNNIRESTLSSRAPVIIHEEDDLIKRYIRDICNDSINNIVIQGRSAYNASLKFIKLISSDSKTRIRLYEEKLPIFTKYKIEQQIGSLLEKQIFLPSGGSIVIDNTEALVAIDVNSGKATKENAVENTAYNTNLEAIDEIARQLRIRDLSGLIVIDFIDMYDQKNRRMVEKGLRDALQNDRARIQIGKISSFGLLEMSRQRLTSSFFETITDICSHCRGTGYVKSVSIIFSDIFRNIRHLSLDKQTNVIYIYTLPDVLSYIMNYKKKEISQYEEQYNKHIFLYTSDNLGSSGFLIKKKRNITPEEKKSLAIANYKKYGDENTEEDMSEFRYEKRNNYKKKKDKIRRKPKQSSNSRKSLFDKIVRIFRND